MRKLFSILIFLILYSTLLKAEVVIVCINRDYKPSKIPDFLKRKIQLLIGQ